MKTRCLIVDDEPLAIKLVRSHLDQIEGIKVVAECESALEAYEVLRNQQVDLMFMDIQMPKITGIEFLKSLKNPPKVIITTAYREYAMEGYDLDVVDYLLKPITFERLLRSIDKYYSIKGDDVKISSDSGKEDSFIYVKENKKVIKIYLKDIDYVESLGEYIQIYTGEHRVITKFALGAFTQKLPEDTFLRIHKSFIVSIPKIKAFTATNIELEHKSLPIGRNYKNTVMSTLNWNVNL
ncbi:MAG: response regulator transcription factor [Bacteroidales bacterium]|nr:response regulator transcription factor [Bacteroidales bacterium]